MEKLAQAQAAFKAHVKEKLEKEGVVEELCELIKKPEKLTPKTNQQAFDEW